MKTFNHVTLIGNLGADPETRTAPSGTPVTTFSIATDRSRMEGGEREKQTEWHRVVAFGRTAEVCGTWLRKGRSVLVHGSLQYRRWQGEDGRPRSRTEVVAREVLFLDAPRVEDETALAS